MKIWKIGETEEGNVLLAWFSPGGWIGLDFRDAPKVELLRERIGFQVPTRPE